MLEFFKTLYDIKKIYNELVLCAKKYPILIFCFIVCCSIIFLFISLFNTDNSEYSNTHQDREIRGIILEAMEVRCKGDLGITIMAVSIKAEQTINGSEYPVEFRYAYAKQDNFISNKIEENSGDNLYNQIYSIPVSYAQLLMQRRDYDLPTYINPKAQETVPDIILKFLKISTWYRLNKMEAFYYDSIVRRSVITGDKLIYIITLSTTSANSCLPSTINSIFFDIKKILL